MSATEKNIEQSIYKNIDQALADAERQRLLPIAKEFPIKLWQLFATHQLLGLTHPREDHGRGLSYLHGVQAGRYLVKKLSSPGFVMAWVMHQFAVPLLSKLLDADTGCRYMDQLSKGAGLLAIAISEPGVGAHPKKLTTQAEKSGEYYILNGEKAHITNGPTADFYIVLAITGREQGRNQFSAFCVPQDTAGLERLEQEDFAALSPLAHCGLRFTDCIIPQGNRLGREGEAFELIGKPIRTYEDALMMGPITGALELLLELMVKNSSPGPVPTEQQQQLGELVAIKDTLNMLAQNAARQLQSDPEKPLLTSCMITFKQLSKHFQELAKTSFPNATQDPQFNAIMADVTLLLSIARSANLAKQEKHGNLYFQDILNENTFT